MIEGHNTSEGTYVLTVSCPTSTTSTLSSTTTTTQTTSTHTGSTVTVTTATTPTTVSTTTTTLTTLNEWWGVLACGVPASGSTATEGANAFTSPNPSAEHNYNFTAAVAGNYTFSTCDSSFDTYLWVYSLSTGVLIAECDDFCNGTCAQAYRTSMTVALAPGSYRVVLEGHRSATGSYSLVASCPSGGRSRRYVSPLVQQQQGQQQACADRVKISVAARVFGETALAMDVDNVLRSTVSSSLWPLSTPIWPATAARLTCERGLPGTVCSRVDCEEITCGEGEVLHNSVYVNVYLVCTYIRRGH